MSAAAANLTTVKIGGPSTAMTGEATTDLGAHTAYRITNAVKRAIDPDVAVTVKKNGSAQTSTLYSVDYAAGIVTFASALLVTDVVTVDGAFRALLAVAQAYAVEADLGGDDPECAVFGDTGGRKLGGRSTCSLSLEHLHMLDEDLDSGAAEQSFNSMREADAVFLEVNFGAASRLAGWFFLGKQGQKASLADAVSGSLQAEGVVRTCTGRPGTDQALWSYV